VSHSVVRCVHLLQADFILTQSPNNLRATWQFYDAQFLWRDAHNRDFAHDRMYFDHFNIRPSAVRQGCAVTPALYWRFTPCVGVCVCVCGRVWTCVWTCVCDLW
jgi:hypothetical protein